MTDASPLTRLRLQMVQERLTAVLITGPHNVRYLTGFGGDDSWLVVTEQEAVFFTDFRYLEQVSQETSGLRVVDGKGKLVPAVIESLRGGHPGRLGFEENQLTVGKFRDLEAGLPGWEWIPWGIRVDGLRTIKTAEELERITGAIGIAERAVENLKNDMREGVTEKFLADRLEFLLREAGANASAFPIIVAFGERASLPHAIPTATRFLAPGEPLLIDWGACCRYYVSDLTRVFFLRVIDEPFAELYGIVLQAQARAIAWVAAGRSLREVDLAAREYIREKGYGDRFGHGTGHGIGREVHEAPVVREKSEGKMEAGQVITIEPGIYLPGKGGIRIEDDVLVTASGGKVLSSYPKDLTQAVIGGGGK